MINLENFSKVLVERLDYLVVTQQDPLLEQVYESLREVVQGAIDESTEELVKEPVHLDVNPGTKYIYLCGPITGLTLEQAKGWRDEATVMLDSVGFTTLCPFSNQSWDNFEGVITSLMSSPCGMTIEEMFKQDVAMLNNCDAVLVKCDGPLESKGSIWEIGYAIATNKPVIMVNNSNDHHPFVRLSIDKQLKTLKDAVDYLEFLLRPLR
jgi:nucleoside 2-deoxyribosyltransferase